MSRIFDKIRKLNLKRFAPLIAILFFSLALFVLHKSMSDFTVHDVEQFIGQLPTGRLWGALFLVFVVFLSFSVYDLLAFQYIDYRLPLKKVIGTSMLSFSFSNVLGGMVLSGGGIRYRSYESSGLSASKILQVSIFVWITWLVGLATFLGLAICFYPDITDSNELLNFPNLRWIGSLLCLIVLLYLFLSFKGVKLISFRGVQLYLPKLSIAIGQITVVGVDLLLSALILYLLLPNNESIQFLNFFAIYVVALALSLFSGIPGGLGVFDVLLMRLLNGILPSAGILGALLVFRIIYYLIPLTVGMVSLGIMEVKSKFSFKRPIGIISSDWVIGVFPQIFGAVVLLAGLFMLFTGTLPLIHGRMEWIKDILPLGLYEISHFMASVVGILLIIFSRELQRKQYGAYIIVLVLLFLGISFESIKFHAIFPSLILVTLFFALLMSRKAFTRHGSLMIESLTWKWFLTLLVVIGATTWLVFFNYKHVDYSNELWWHFSFSGDASRSLRALAGVMVITLTIGLRRLLRPRTNISLSLNEADIDDIRIILSKTPSASSALALLRDKAILFSPSRKSFIMYGVSNGVLIAMGDPVGDDTEFLELIWSFRELGDSRDFQTIFYEVSDTYISYYADAGFSFFKLGEEAIISLSNFSLEGSSRTRLRQALRRIDKVKYKFDVISIDDVPKYLPRIKDISDAWLKDKASREKGFSLGRFDETYLLEFPIAVVRDDNEEVVAFANLWVGDGHSELSMDLMRYLPNAPTGIMDYLFINLFLWGKEQGYKNFNMGMSPLSGLDSRSLSPMWTKFGDWLFENGEYFYHFQGLRRYKAKYHPQWKAKYLASMGGIQLPKELVSITSIISMSSK